MNAKDPIKVFDYRSFSIFSSGCKQPNFSTVSTYVSKFGCKVTTNFSLAVLQSHIFSRTCPKATDIRKVAKSIVVLVVRCLFMLFEKVAPAQ